MNQLDEAPRSTAPRGQACFTVGAFEVEPARNRLRLASAPFPVEPLVMDVLCYLAEHAGEVVARNELINHVWFFNPHADESLTRAIALLRRIFRHDEEQQARIETIWKRGYSLLADVRHPATGLARHGTPDWQRAFNLDTQYSVAVLSFRNNSVEAEDAFLADGITRDLSMLLSRVPRLRVAAYSSAMRVDEKATSLSEVSRELGVRYVVSGSLTRQSNRLQVRAALMDAFDDAQIWAQRIDAYIEQFFEVQDKLVLDISTSIASALQVSFCEAMQGRRPFQLSAYELVQRAENLRIHYNRDTAMEIVTLLDRALTLEPGDAAVHAALAVQHTQNVVSNFGGKPPAETFALAKRHVETALELAPQDPDVLAAAGIAATMMGNARLAVRNLSRAVELDPNNPHTLAVLGWQHCWLYGDKAGIEMIETAERRAPHHPRFSIWAHYRGHCHIRMGEVDQAIAAYQQGVARNPGYSLNLVTLAAAQALAGQMEDARETVESIRGIAPAYSCADFERLAKRMVYWFGACPSREQMINALHRAWSA